VFTGVVETQPYDSNTYRCKGNFTAGYDAGDRYYNSFNTIADQWDEREYQTNWFTDLSYILKVPFGVPFSCYFGYEDIAVLEDPYEDGVFTIEEALEERIMISHHYLTNLLFNAGYMYADVVSILELKNTSTNYFENLGIYSGDFLIRIFWRRRFTRNFSYIEGNPDLPDPYTQSVAEVVDDVP
jgi:hypothetical protein